MKIIWRCFYRSLKIVLRTDKNQFFCIIVLSIVLGIIPGCSLVMMQRIINLLQIDNSKLYTIVLFALIYIFIDMLNYIVSKIIAIVTFSLERRTNINVSLLVLEKTKMLELSDYEDVSTYDLIQRAQNSNIVYAYMMLYISVMQAIVVVVSNLLILKKWIIFIFPLVAGITVIRMIHLSKIGKKKYIIRRDRTSDERKQWYYRYLMTNDMAFKEIKIFDLYDYFITKFKELSINFYTTDKKIYRQQNIVDGVLLLLDCFVTGCFFIFFIIMCKIGNSFIGDVIAYIRSISNIKKSIESLCLQIVVIWENTLQVSQLFELLDINGTEIAVGNKIDIGVIKKIELVNLSYKYRNSNKYVLKNINLVIEASQIYYLVGLNGSGKSTLMKIIAGYYSNYEGTILVNGVNLRDIDRKLYRKKIGILLQDYVKYELTLRENVAISNLDNLNDNIQIQKDLCQVGFNKKISLDSQLGYWFDNGYQLSGGEWLKVALARALNCKADIYFLDEPNAALDPVANKELLELIDQVLTGKIGVIVTHKISSIVRHKGKIIYLDQGEILGLGIHSELYNSCEDYRNFIDAKPL